MMLIPLPSQPILVLKILALMNWKNRGHSSVFGKEKLYV